jgi:transposase
MSLPHRRFEEVPEETVEVARAAFPKGNIYMRLRDEFSSFYEDDDFAALFPAVGQPGENPWRLAMVLVMQFMENLTDRQAADAVRGRIDWKYALCLELTDPGFDFSVLSEFRSRLVQGGMEEKLLERLLAHFQQRGLVKAGGRQRTDATHVLAAVHGLNRLEMVGRTLQAALEELAQIAPGWLKAQISPDWFDRYQRKIDEYRLPKGGKERQATAEQIGGDGQVLLKALDQADAPDGLRQLASVAVLRQVWEQQYEWQGGQFRWRNKDDLPPSGERRASPYEPDARYGMKRDVGWVGYKVHLTETCDEEMPHLITQVETTPATDGDILALASIQSTLAQRRLLPRQQVVDMGYGAGETIADSQQQYQVDLLCPVHTDTSWQAQTEGAFDQRQFDIDWQEQQVRCPQGHLSRSWVTEKLDHGTPAIFVRFRSSDCQPCPVRTRCTRSQTAGRELTLIPQEAYLALQAARQRQKTGSFLTDFAVRAGVEGTLSQAVQVCGLRRARYRGLPKVHLQHVLTAAALNLYRIVAWLNDRPRAMTRISHFAALAV